MRTAPTARFISLATAALLVACGTESGELPSEPERVLVVHQSSFAGSEWSEPVNLGALVNSSSNECGPALSKDLLSLYFHSPRPGGFGAVDIWVSQRGCRDCPWEAPVNLGPVINTPGVDISPNLSIDGHLLFFASTRPGGHGEGDIWVSRRANPKDDFGWGPPVNLGPGVNTPDVEMAPVYRQSAEDGAANLYFSRGWPTDLYYTPLTRDGETRGPAVLVSELNDPAANDQFPTVRTDGREIIFWSQRSGSAGGVDLWVSTRRSVHDPWSAPMNLGPPVNTDFIDATPSLSFDGRALMICSNRPGSLGGTDIWMSTRTPSGR